MQQTNYIPRKLVVEDRFLTERQVMDDGRHVVVLAEPGAGKTELLESFSRFAGVKRHRASVFRARSIVNADQTLIVDGIDEVAKLDQSAFDDLIGKIADVEPQRVILASRSSEWDSKRNSRLISNFLGTEPLVVRLKAFEEPEQRQLFEHLQPGKCFSTFKGAVTEFGLHVLLGNPQMLGIFALAYGANDGVFVSRSQIFADAFVEMCREHNPDIPAKHRLTSKKISAFGGELFAKLLLSGATGIADSEVNADRGFPFLEDLIETTGSASRQVIDTNLFKPSDEDGKHEPVHRIVAEFGAARYLAERINSATEQLTLSRALALIAPNGALRDDLRGLLAWLTVGVHQEAQKACIKISPYAVLSNGDPSQLPDASKILLIEKLAELSETDPYFRRADRWRSFSTKGFFTANVVERVRQLLIDYEDESDLKSLLLEIIENSGEEALLESELSAILLSCDADYHTRLQAMNALAGIDGRNWIDDFKALKAEGSLNSLRLASELIIDGSANPSNEALLELLKSFIPLYKGDDLALDQPAGSTYFISLLIASFRNNQVTYFLNELTRGLRCTCGKKRSFECHCRVGISKLVGQLLDRYFETAFGPHSPAQLWRWMKALNFRNAKTERDSQSVKVLQDQHSLRREIHLLALEGLSEEGEIRDAIGKFWFGEMHSGLFIRGDDETWLLKHAARTKRFGMFAAFYRTHGWYSKFESPSQHRLTQKLLSRSDIELLRIAASKERRSRLARREHIEKRYRFQGRYRKRENRIEQTNAAHFAQYRDQIAKGEHWSWLKDFGWEYLQKEFDPEGVIKFAGDAKFIEKALRSSVPFLVKHAPALDEIGQAKAEGKSYHLPQVAYAALLAVFRETGSLETVPRSLIAVAKTDINVHHSGISDEERKAFHSEIDRRLFPSKREKTDYLKSYVEPQLSSGTLDHTSAEVIVWDKAFADVAEEISFRWLREFPDMPLSSADTLLDVAAKSQRHAELAEIISKQCDRLHRAWPYGPPERKQKDRRDFWFLRSFAISDAKDEWPVLKQFADNIFAFSNRYDSFSGSRDEAWPALTARKIFLLLDAFVDDWPAVPLPSSWGTGSPKEQTAYRFLNSLIWRFSDDRPGEQIKYLKLLLADSRFEKWHDAGRHLLSEAKRRHLLRNFSAPTPEAVCGLLNSSRVSTVEDLRALVLEELKAAERWFREGETDPLEAFYEGGKHVSENTARNRIVDWLKPRLTPLDVVVSIESAMANQNRCDFTAGTSIEGQQTRLVVEVKGQWHPELFEAATTQLYDRYSHHPDAAEQGIYLVLWFGSDVKIAAKKGHGIQTPVELEEAIKGRLASTLVDTIDIMVIDLSRK